MKNLEEIDELFDKLVDKLSHPSFLHNYNKSLERLLEAKFWYNKNKNVQCFWKETDGIKK